MQPGQHLDFGLVGPWVDKPASHTVPLQNHELKNITILTPKFMVIYYTATENWYNLSIQINVNFHIRQY